MTTATLPAPPTAAAPSRGPTPRVWTVAEFHDLGDQGYFEGRGAMLIDGHILEEGAMNPPHRIALELTTEAIRAAFGTGWRFCVQMPLVLGPTTAPQPDLAVVAGNPRTAAAHPTTADLVVEISDTSLAYDTAEKMSLYATAGIRDYWVLDVNGRQLLVHRDPVPAPAAPFRFAYSSIRTLAPADAVSPVALPTASVRVADMLP